MAPILRFTRAAVALALGVLFLLSQRSDSSAREDRGSVDARDTAFTVVRALERLVADVGRPELQKRIPNDAVLLGRGEVARHAPPAGRGFGDLFVTNAFGVDHWSGPYLDDLPPDPWGRAFVVTVAGFPDARQRVWILSAGPNGRLETTSRDHAPHGDDIGLIGK